MPTISAYYLSILSFFFNLFIFISPLITILFFVILFVRLVCTFSLLTPQVISQWWMMIFHRVLKIIELKTRYIYEIITKNDKIIQIFTHFCPQITYNVKRCNIILKKLRNKSIFFNFFWHISWYMSKLFNSVSRSPNLKIILDWIFLTQLEAEVIRMNAENQKLREMLGQVSNNYTTLQMHLETLMQQQHKQSSHHEHQVIY